VIGVTHVTYLVRAQVVADHRMMVDGPAEAVARV
jgi:hypothetical protein